MSDFKLEWHGKELVAEIEDMCETAVKERAKAVARDAKRILRSKIKHKNKSTRGLEKSIHIKTFKKPGVFGAYIKAGEKGKEHIAGFVELGTPGTTMKVQNPGFTYTKKRRRGNWKTMAVKRTPIKAASYMRPALKKNKSKIRKAFENRLK